MSVESVTKPGRIPSADPKASFLSHRQEIEAAIQKVLESGRYILGSETEAFESEFASYLGLEHAVGVASGTDALQLALLACGAGPGREVITASFTSGATAAAIQLCGASPVLVEIDPERFTLDPERIESAITTRTRCIVPVHLYGCPAEMEGILEVAHRYGLSVVEDCAQSHGAAIGDRMTGAWGDVSAFSFYPTKNLGAIGDGGLVATDDPELGERLALLREYGWRRRYVSETAGTNSRLDELQAAVLRVKLKFLDEANRRRRELAKFYTSRLSGLDFLLPAEPPRAFHVYHQYVLRSPRRDALKNSLDELNVDAAVLYPVPIHLQPGFAGCRVGQGGLAHTERVSKEILCLPIYPELSDTQAEIVSKAVLAFGQVTSKDKGA